MVTVTQIFIFSFQIAHDNQVRLKICHCFSFPNNRFIIQKTIISVVFHWLTGDPKNISGTTNAMDMGPTLKYLTSKT